MAEAPANCSDCEAGTAFRLLEAVPSPRSGRAARIHGIFQVAAFMRSGMANPYSSERSLLAKLSDTV
jgi:hypothetical protein